MRFIFFLAILTTRALCAPTAANSGRDTTVSNFDEDAKVIYPDYRRSPVAASSDEDTKVIYPDYRRSPRVSGSDEDTKVIYPDY
ncbi:hypothetical protein F4777DRAFT_572908 [Nemania sp. FL0916]|nr:hypothetical protein F4777DRAFT_572908 [Nemania sp. FL0916]